jgi:phosphoglycerate dehydrogenase-like enzyme
LNIVVVSPVDATAIDVLRADHDVALAIDDFGVHRSDMLSDREVLVFRSGVEIPREIMDLAPRLALVVRAGSGFDNIDLDYARARGIRVVRIPGPSAQAVAEFTLGLMIAVSRNMVRADTLVRDGLWPKPQLGGGLLIEKVLGIVGAGNIGARVGELGAAWGMEVIGCIDPAQQDPNELTSRGIEPQDFDSVIRHADFLTVHTPLNQGTRYLIGAPELAAMKTGAFLVNTARGGIVDEEALYGALLSGHLGGAALDVHEREGDGVIPKLADLPNVILTPHIGGMALESQALIGRRMIQLIEAHEEGNLDQELAEAERVV